MRKIFLLILFLAIPHLLLAGPGADSTDVQKEISYLLKYVAKSDAVLIRNGSEHNGKEAEAHLQQKYDHFKKQIKTPEDFIRLAASKSMVSGKPYLVRLKGGKEIPCADWLTQALKEYRETNVKKAGV